VPPFRGEDAAYTYTMLSRGRDSPRTVLDEQAGWPRCDSRASRGRIRRKPSSRLVVGKLAFEKSDMKRERERERVYACLYARVCVCERERERESRAPTRTFFEGASVRPSVDEAERARFLFFSTSSPRARAHG